MENVRMEWHQAKTLTTTRSVLYVVLLNFKVVRPIEVPLSFFLLYLFGPLHQLLHTRYDTFVPSLVLVLMPPSL